MASPCESTADCCQKMPSLEWKVIVLGLFRKGRVKISLIVVCVVALVDVYNACVPLVALCVLYVSFLRVIAVWINLVLLKKKNWIICRLMVDYLLDNWGNAFTSNRVVTVHGADILGSDGGAKEDEWFLHRKQLVVTCCQLYDLPDGNIGKRFVGLLADQIELLYNGKVRSERAIMFCGVIPTWSIGPEEIWYTIFIEMTHG